MSDPQGPEGAAPRAATAAPVERFHATSGHVMGWLSLVIALVVVVVGLFYVSQGFPVPLVVGAALFGILGWVVLLRPRVWATEEHLVMRNILHTEWIPLAAIEQVAVRQVLAVKAGERRFVSPAIGRTRRQLIAQQRTRLPQAPLTQGLGGGAVDGGGGTNPTALDSYPVFVEERISRLAEDARAKQGVRRFSDEQAALAAGARRSWAWPEIAALVLVVAGLVVAIVL